MRKLLLCAILALCSSACYGQAQWKVIKTVFLNHQNGDIPVTLLFKTPAYGMYRISGYMSAKNLDLTMLNGWSCSIEWTDLVNQSIFDESMSTLGSQGITSNISAYVFSPLKGTDVTFSVATVAPPPPNAEYFLGITIERLF